MAERAKRNEETRRKEKSHSPVSFSFPLFPVSSYEQHLLFWAMVEVRAMWKEMPA